MSMGMTAENVATKYGVLRAHAGKDYFAVQSHTKARRRRKPSGKLERKNIVPITTLTMASVDKDGCIRAGTTVEKLAELKPAFNEKGSVTAGTSSPLTDGAAATWWSRKRRICARA